MLIGWQLLRNILLFENQHVWAGMRGEFKESDFGIRVAQIFTHLVNHISDQLSEHTSASICNTVELVFLKRHYYFL